MARDGNAERGNDVHEVGGNFDMAAALLLREEVALSPRSSVTVDFSHAARFDDAALAMLTVTLVLLLRRGLRVTMLGLSDRASIILEQFGIELAEGGLVRIVLPEDRARAHRAFRAS
jgi:anti-anti-sigma regulatory factor